MNVIVNGKPTAMQEGATVADTIEVSGHAGGTFGVAIAVNGEVIARSAWALTPLSPDDKVEVLVAAQGG